MEEQIQPSEELSQPAETVDASDTGASLDGELDQIYSAHEEAGQPQEEQKPVEEEQKPAVEEVLKAPHTWGKDTQELFKNLPVDIQKQIIKRETERENVVREAFNSRNFAQAMMPFAQLIRNMEGYFKSFVSADGKPLWGNGPAMAKEIADVLAVKQLLVRDPAAGLHVVQEWAKKYGYSPEGAEQNEENLNLRARLGQLEQQDAQRQAQLEQQRRQAQQEQSIRSVAQHIQGLGAQKDAQGNDAYPLLNGEHGAKIGHVMGQWIRANIGQGGITPDLFKQAYDTAVFSIPETREAEFKARETARITEQQQKVQAARNAAGITPSSKRPPATENETTLEQDLEAIWAKYA